jgi:hypothetical protein
MRFLLRFIIFFATVAGVLALIIGGIGLGTGNFDFLESVGLPNPGSLQTAPSSGSAPAAEDSTTETGTDIVLSFTWRGDEIIYNDAPISEAEFGELLAEAKEKDVKVEIVKFSDVRVEVADRWRQMLDTAGVRYEVIPQE